MKKIKKMIKKTINSFVTWMSWIVEAILTPFVKFFSRFVKQKDDLILFMGRKSSGFIDNVKYMMIYLYEHGYNEKYQIVFVGYNDRAYNQIKAAGFEAIQFPSLDVYKYIMRAKVIVTDNAHWTTHNRFNAASRPVKIQMWHGIGFKKIRLSDADFVKKSKGIKGYLKYVLPGMLAVYDEFLTTSDFFTKEVFEPSFLPKNFFVSGYPRNDVFMGEEDFNKDHYLINADEVALTEIQRIKEAGGKIVLYAPTFRNAKKYEVGSDNIDFSELSDFGRKNNIYFVFKLHPLPKYNIKFSSYTNVLEYNSKCDVYPAFKYVDLMITDYSSIYLDYLLLDRPCVFFMYDYEYYRYQCRDIRDDFMELTPGEKCYTQEELTNVLRNILIDGKDDFAAERKRIRDLSWDYQGGKSCEKVWDYITEKYL